LEQSNQFYVKAHSYKVEDGKFMKLAINDDDSIGGYTIQVFEDNKDGKFALTKDNQKVRYWKEYSLLDYGNGLPGYGYEYGMMTLEKNAVAEEFLENQFKVQEIRSKIEALDLSAIAGKDVKNVSSAELANVKKQIDAVNKDIKAFNKDKNKLRAEYINGKINDVKNSSDSEAAKKKAIKSIKKENFPEIALVKLEKNDASNIDYSVQIEPGYMVTVGMNNFTKIVTNRSITTPFIKVFIWTVIWSLVSVIGSFAVGLALALVFNSSDLKGKYAYRTIFILPYAIPGFVSILMWQGFFNEDFGVINNFFNCHIPWLTTNGTMAKVSVLIVNIWMSFPYNMLISLGALQSIDSSMYEAADVDGATGPQQFWMITLPLLMIALGPMLVGSFAFAFNNFAGIYLLTGGGPVMAAGVLPGHTDILISYTYKLAFGEQNKDYGLASAIAIIVFLIIGTITFLQFKFTGTFKEVDNA
jgi:ABC-type sugar transport system permease subunit